MRQKKKKWNDVIKGQAKSQDIMSTILGSWVGGCLGSERGIDGHGEVDQLFGWDYKAGVAEIAPRAGCADGEDCA